MVKKSAEASASGASQTKGIRTVLLNLPNKERVFRRYMCSYNSPTSLFPPIELMGLAAIVKRWKKQPVMLLDAVAEGLDTAQTIARLKEFGPDLILSLTGFEIFNEDIAVLDAIKDEFPKCIVGCFGYYPTLFPKETLERSTMDFIILNEPDLVFSGLYDLVASGKPFVSLGGIAFRNGGAIRINPKAERIKDLDALPIPAHELLNLKLYSETMADKPFTVLHTTRGCPFACTYCVHTYGRQLFQRSAESVLDEIEFVVKELGVRSFRFFDDTFNVDKQRLKAICGGIIERGIKARWTCFSRVNTLDEESLALMKRAGCIRAFIGVESGSQRVLDFYKKGYDAKEIKRRVQMARRAGIETTGFFMVGPYETEDDFRKSIGLAKDSAFDYILVTKLTPYPGTELFDRMRGEINFSLFPYKNEMKKPDGEKKFFEMEKLFYREFYFRPSYVIGRIGSFLRRPLETAYNLAKLSAYLAGLERQEARQDYF